jgi:hypothetical protein
MPTIASGPKRTDTFPQLPFSMANIRNITPNKINGLMFWLDASDSSSITLSNDGTVNRVISWRDKSTNAVNLNIGSPIAPSNFPFQSTIQGSPYNTVYFSTGMTAIRSASYISGSVRSFFFVSPQLQRVPAGTAQGDMDAVFLFGGSFGNDWHGSIGSPYYFLANGFTDVNLRNSIGKLRVFNKTTNTLLSQSNILINLTPYSSANASILLWSTSIPSGTSTGFNGIGFDRTGNANRGFPGHIGEIVMFNRNLNTEEESQMVSYLTQKWSLQCNVPGEAAYNQSLFNLAATPRFFTPYTQFSTVVGFRFLTYTLPISNVQFWYDAMDTAVFTDINGRSPPTPNNPIELNSWRNKGTLGTTLGVGRIGQFPFPIFNIFGTNRYPEVNTRLGNYSYFRADSAGYAYPGGKNITCFIVFTVYFAGGAIFTIHSGFANDSTNSGKFFGVIANTTQFGYSSGTTPMFAASITTNRTYVGTIIINSNTTTSIGGALPSNGLINLNGAYAANSSNIGPATYDFTQMALFGYINSGTTQRGQGLNEVVCCYRAVTTTERVAMENQLLAKWGISRNAPVSYLATSVPVTSGLQMWYDAYSPAFVTTNSSNQVTSWLDRSGNGYHLSNAGSNPVVYTTLTSQTNNLPALQFTFSNATSNYSALQNFNISNIATSTITTIAAGYFVANPIPSAPEYFILSMGSTINSFESLRMAIGRDAIYNSTSNTVANSRYTQSNFQIHTLVANTGTTSNGSLAASNMVSYVNGSNPTTSTAPYLGMITVSNVRIGASLFDITSANAPNRTTQGFFTEFLVWDRCLTTAELTSAHTYLFNKWTIVSTAPVANVPVTSGLTLWLDAYDSAQVIRDSAGAVWMWRDKSGCNFHFTNTNANNTTVFRPTYSTTDVNGLPGLLFTSDLTTTATTLYNMNFVYPTRQDMSLFIVFKSRGSVGRLLAVLSNGSTDYAFAGGVSITGISALRNYCNLSAPYTSRTVAQVGFIWNSSRTDIPDIPQSNLGITRNGVVLATGNQYLDTNFTFNQLIIGSRVQNAGDPSSYYDGYVSEYLMYNRTVTFNERQQIESYLLNKWNI